MTDNYINGIKKVITYRIRYVTDQSCCLTEIFGHLYKVIDPPENITLIKLLIRQKKSHDLWSEGAKFCCESCYYLYLVRSNRLIAYGTPT